MFSVSIVQHFKFTLNFHFVLICRWCTMLLVSDYMLESKQRYVNNCSIPVQKHVNIQIMYYVSPWACYYMKKKIYFLWLSWTCSNFLHPLGPEPNSLWTSFWTSLGWNKTIAGTFRPYSDPGLLKCHFHCSFQCSLVDRKWCHICSVVTRLPTELRLYIHIFMQLQQHALL
jgi:hypothetical protein